MIQEVTIDGREALVSYFDASGALTTSDQCVLSEIRFADGEIRFAVPSKRARHAAGFDPSQARDKDGQWTDGAEVRKAAIQLYHSTSDEFVDNKPDFDAYFGNLDFRNDFPNEFGPNTYSVRLPRDMSILDLNKPSAAAREFMAMMSENAWPEDSAYAQQLRQGKPDGDGNDEFYDIWVEKQHALAVLRSEKFRRQFVGVKFQGEYILPRETIRSRRLPGKKMRRHAAGFDPSQARDKDGQWSNGDGVTDGDVADASIAWANETFPRLALTESKNSGKGLYARDETYGGVTVDGLVVRTEIDNLDSIPATFNDEDEYDVLPGIREVSLDGWTKQKYMNKSDNDWMDRLAQKIKASGEITPLIVVVDGTKQPWILEGSHRIDALLKLGKRKFPAIVVADHRKTHS